MILEIFKFHNKYKELKPMNYFLTLQQTHDESGSDSEKFEINPLNLNLKKHFSFVFVDTLGKYLKSGLLSKIYPIGLTLSSANKKGSELINFALATENSVTYSQVCAFALLLESTAKFFGHIAAGACETILKDNVNEIYSSAEASGFMTREECAVAKNLAMNNIKVHFAVSSPRLNPAPAGRLSHNNLFIAQEALVLTPASSQRSAYNLYSGSATPCNLDNCNGCQKCDVLNNEVGCQKRHVFNNAEKSTQSFLPQTKKRRAALLNLAAKSSKSGKNSSDLGQSSKVKLEEVGSYGLVTSYGNSGSNGVVLTDGKIQYSKPVSPSTFVESIKRDEPVEMAGI